LEELKVAHQQQLQELQLRHQSELRGKEDRFVAERKAWEENLMRRQEADWMAKEREMRRKLREERDKVCLSAEHGAVCECLVCPCLVRR